MKIQLLTILFINVETLLAEPPKLFAAFDVKLKLLVAPDEGILNGSVVKLVFDMLLINK